MTKDQLIEKYRYINTKDHSWWDDTYDCFKERMTAIGVDVDKMYFSGFCSQGDGACFEGSVSEWGLFLKSVGYTDPALVRLAKYEWSFRVRHYGYYYHENCTSFYTDMPNPDGEDDEWFLEKYSTYDSVADIRAKAWLAVLRRYDFAGLEREFTEAFKDHMRQLYKDLEADYDYRTSDEAVWDTIVANELDDITEESEE
jgi:hypothetical protein